MVQDMLIITSTTITTLPLQWPTLERGLDYDKAEFKLRTSGCQNYF